MRLSPQPAGLARTLAQGRYFLSLLEDPTWVLRRVDTVNFVDSHRIERRTSLDLDLARVRDLAAKSGLGRRLRTVYVPLGLLKKNLMLDFDVRSSSGEPLVLATSDQDSRASQAVLVARAARHVDPRALTGDVREQLFRIAREMPHSDDQRALSGDAQGDLTILGWKFGSTSLPAQQTWSRLFSITEFRELVVAFTLRFMPIIGLEDGRDRCIVKFRTVESEGFPPASGVFSLAGVFALSERLYFVEAPTTGIGGVGSSVDCRPRQHLRIEAPAGTFMTDATMIRFVGGDAPDSLRPAKSADVVHKRVTMERGAFYSFPQPGERYSVLLLLMPRLEGFALPAIVGATLSGVLLLSGTIAEFSLGTLDRILGTDGGGAGNTEAAVALLLIVPSIFLAYLARPGEHEVRAEQLKWLRYAVGLSSAAVAPAAVAAIAFTSSSAIAWVWGVCGGVALAIAALLSSVVIRNRIFRKRVLSESHETSPSVVLEL